MPYSWCTTRSPSAISVASAMNWSARLRRRGGREMRSPSRSCSPTRASRSATKPRSTPSVTSETEPAGLRRTAGPIVLRRGILEAVLAQQIAPAARASPRVQAATTIRRPSPFQRSACARKLIEHVGRRGRRQLCDEHRPRPAAAIDADRAIRPGERREREQRADRQHRRPSRRGRDTARSGGSGRYGTSPSRGTAMRRAA